MGLAQAVGENGRVDALDLSEAMIDQARPRAVIPIEGKDNITIPTERSKQKRDFGSDANTLMPTRSEFLVGISVVSSLFDMSRPS